MTTQILIYVVLFLAVAAYVAINIFHLIRFRLGFRGDKTGFAIVGYLVVVIAILIFSWFGAFVAFSSIPA